MKKGATTGDLTSASPMSKTLLILSAPVSPAVDGMLKLQNRSHRGAGGIYFGGSFGEFRKIAFYRPRAAWPFLPFSPYFPALKLLFRFTECLPMLVLSAGTRAFGGHFAFRHSRSRGGANPARVQQQTDTLGVAFVIGLLIAIVSANSGMVALFDALNVVYGEREKRSIVHLYTTTFLFTLAGIVFVILALIGLVIIPLALRFIGLAAKTEALISVFRWPVLLVTVGASLAFLYRYGPSRRDARWRWVTWGSIFAATLWIAASMLFSWYVATFDSYNRVYGSLGAGIGFMVWLWISAVIVLLGGEVNAEMEHQTARDTTEGGPRPLGLRGATMATTWKSRKNSIFPSKPWKTLSP